MLCGLPLCMSPRFFIPATPLCPLQGGISLDMPVLDMTRLGLILPFLLTCWVSLEKSLHIPDSQFLHLLNGNKCEKEINK